MKITIGTENPTKIAAVREILAEYSQFAEADIVGVAVQSSAADQPTSLDETVDGALSRAVAAWTDDVDYSIGLESGLMAVPKTTHGTMDVCVCAIYDGQQHHLGLSSAWEPPQALYDAMQTGLNMSHAAKAAGLTDKDYIGHEEGVISVLTGGRLDRKEYTKQSLRTALIHLDFQQKQNHQD